MSFSNILSSAASGMAAQTIRLNVTASNLANANSVGTTPDTTYRARQPVFESVFQNTLDGNGGTVGIRVSNVVTSDELLAFKYQPDHPLANEEGNVFLSNVNPIEEMANMISASRNYETNVQLASTAKELMLKTLQLGR